MGDTEGGTMTLNNAEQGKRYRIRCVDGSEHRWFSPAFREYIVPGNMVEVLSRHYDTITIGVNRSRTFCFKNQVCEWIMIDPHSNNLISVE